MDLIDAFDLKAGAVVSAVGGGGKTSLAYALAEQAAIMGLTSIVTTTTKFTRRRDGPMPAVVEASDAGSLRALESALEPGRAMLATSGGGPRGRFLGFAPETIDNWNALGAGMIAIEADGSANRPFKAPAEHEPVIPASSTDIVVCVGLEVLGKPLDERHVHRPEIVARLAEVERGSLVTIETLLRVLVHEQGGRKGKPEGARLHALLNAPDDDEQRKLGSKLAGRLIFGGYHRAIVGTLHQDEIDMIAC